MIRAARVLGRLAMALAVAAGAFLLLYRPLHLRWGATDAEIVRVMPADEIQPRPVFNATRAITIEAPPEDIFPWLLQIGYGRAGWYGLDLLDNAGIPSARRIIPELQDLKPGDVLPIFRELAHHHVAAVEPNSYLLTTGHDGTTWIWALYPVDEGRTRLVWRIRAAPYDWTPSTTVPLLITELVDFVAVRENMLGIKERVEGGTPQPPFLPYAEAALWLVSFVGFLIAEIRIVRSRDWRRPLAVAVGAALLTIAVVMIAPALWIDALVAAGVVAALRWARPAAPRQERAS